jgi:hypothetical protein
MSFKSVSDGGDLTFFFLSPSGTGFANTITPQENGELAKAGNTAPAGFDVVSGSRVVIVCLF